MLNSTKLQNLNLIPKQKLALALGNYGCYFACLCRIAEKITDTGIDLIESFYECKNKNWIESDCYVKNPEKIVEFLTGKKTSVLKIYNTFYIPAENEYIIGCYENLNGGHFVLLSNSDKSVEYDPLENSNTVRTGKLKSLRIIKIEN